jgi:cell wall-associated NlpC family hydrolase
VTDAGRHAQLGGAGVLLLAVCFLFAIAPSRAGATIEPKQAREIVNYARIVQYARVPETDQFGKAITDAEGNPILVPYAYCYGGGTLEGASQGWTDPFSDGEYQNCAELGEGGRTGFDATGLTWYAVYQATGNAGLSHGPGQAESLGGQAIENKSALRPGDLVYFDYDPSHELRYIDHVGVYLEGGEVLSAVSEHYGIREEPISWFEGRGLHFVGGVRFWRGTGEPVGGYELATSPVPGEVEVGGWALDQDAKPTPVQIYAEIGGEIGVTGAQRHDLGVADQERQDVAEAFPGAGSAHGFRFTFETDKTGYQPVCLYAVNIGPGKDSRLDCEFFFIPDPNPSGGVYLAVSPGPATIRISGWATDPNTPGSAVGIRAYVGGKANQPGTEVHDLGLANSAGFANHGFDFTFETQKVGNLPVCVYAINTGAGSDSLLACDSLSVSPKSSAVAPFVPATQPRRVKRHRRHRRHHRRHRHKHHHKHRARHGQRH